MKYVTYFRVSTASQGASGLGLDAQKHAVQSYAPDTIAEYVEVESGKVDDRPQLLAAIAKCQATGATLLIAKLDRLSRDAAFLFTLRKSGVNIVAADMPSAGMLEFGVRAIFAQHEREQISMRTKAALQQAKASGKVLGCPCPKKGAKASAKAKQAKANAYAQALTPTLLNLVDKCDSYQDLADALTLAGVSTPSGGSHWRKSSAHAVLKRAGLSL